MNSDLGFAPDYAESPGDYLSVLLSELEMSQADLAARTGLSTKHINQLIKSRATLSPETATQLEFVTNVPAGVWASLDARYQAHLARERASKRFGSSLDWLDRFDLAELARRKVIPAATRTGDTVEALLRFFGISDPDGWSRVWKPSLTSFRRSPSFTPDATATTVWLRAGQRAAAAVDTAPYSQRRLLDTIPALRSLTVADPATALVQMTSVLADCGVALVLVAEFDGCRASGATWWASPNKAVVMLSNRGKREDRLWFSLFHELGHVVHHAKRDTFIDESRTEGERPPWAEPAPASVLIDDGSRDSALEQEADDFASDALVPPALTPRIKALSTADQVEQLAAEIGISAGIVAGRYQFLTKNYKKFNSHRRPVPHDLFL